MSLGDDSGPEQFWTRREDADAIPSKRRKQNLSSLGRAAPAQSQDLFDGDPFDSDLRDDFEGSDWPSLGMGSYRGQLAATKPAPGHAGVEVRHVDITAEDPFGNREKQEDKSKKSKKPNSKMKSTFDDIALDELRHYRRLSGNTLWSLVQKRKMGLGPSSAGASGPEDTPIGSLGAGAGLSAVSSPGGSFASGNGGMGGGGSVGSGPGLPSSDKAMNKRLQQLWGCLPEKERRIWKSKAKRIMKQLQCIQRREASQAASGKQVSAEVTRQKERQRITNRLAALKTASVTTADMAAQLKLIGDGLLSMGESLKMQTTPVAVHGVDFVLLDSLLCAVPPLLALCGELPGLEGAVDKDDMCETVDALAHMMPGLY